MKPIQPEFQAQGLGDSQALGLDGTFFQVSVLVQFGIGAKPVSSDGT